MELNGGASREDYLARSMMVLSTFQIRDPTNGKFNASSFVDISMAQQMLKPGHQELEHGYVRRSDGTWYIACHTDLGDGCNGEMFDWWFRNCDNTERYRWWHPKDHIEGEWNPQFYAVQPPDRVFGHYIGHTHRVTEVIAGVKQTIRIEFERPSKYFDVNMFPSARVTACICGRISIEDPTMGLIAVGHVIHMVRETGNGNSELRSRFWLGDIDKVQDDDVLLSFGLVNCLGNTCLFRRIKATTHTARGLWVHCAQEMMCLKAFLPHFYRIRQQEEKIEKQKWANLH